MKSDPTGPLGWGLGRGLITLSLGKKIITETRPYVPRATKRIRVNLQRKPHQPMWVFMAVLYHEQIGIWKYCFFFQEGGKLENREQGFQNVLK